MASQTRGHPYTLVAKPVAEALGLEPNKRRQFAPLTLEIGDQRYENWAVDVVPRERLKDPRVTVEFGRDLEFLPYRNRSANPAYPAPDILAPSYSAKSALAGTYSIAARARETTVLVLGEDSKRLPVLRSIQAWLETHAWDSALVRDLPDIPEQTIEEKVQLLASMSKFVICDDASPSGHIAELRLLSELRIATAIMSPWMAEEPGCRPTYEVDRAFIGRFRYTHSPIEKMHEACRWALGQQELRRSQLDGIYPWRTHADE